MKKASAYNIYILFSEKIMINILSYIKTKHYICNILFVLLATYISAVESSPINKDMASIGEAMGKLLLVVINDKAFSAANNQKSINGNLSIISNKIEKVEHHFTKRSITYQVSYGIIKNQISNIQIAFQNKKYSHAQSMLKAAAYICTSCHTQDQKQRTIFKGLNREVFSSDYEFAEYNFITRNYDPALVFYKKYLRQQTTHQSEKYHLQALKNILIVYAQVYNKPEAGADALSKYMQSNNLSLYAKTHVKEWVSGLRMLNRTEANNQKITYQVLENYVNKYIGPSDSLNKAHYHAWLKGMLYRYLNSNPNEKEIPSILYWLSVTDRVTEHNIYYSLGDLYLKQCMISYPASLYAKKCFSEYKEYTTFIYSGTRGTHIPNDIQTELDELEKIVFDDHGRSNVTE
jgi:hypothetical protein